MSTKKKTARVSSWWREPIRAIDLLGVGKDEAQALIALRRIELKSRAIEMIRELREYSDVFSAAGGYSLRPGETTRISNAKYKKLKAAHVALTLAKSKPFVAVSPRTVAQRKSTIQRAGELFRGQKKFLVHDIGDPSQTRARFRSGQLEIVETFGLRGGTIVETYDRLYLFPRAPGSWDDVIDYTRDLQSRGMRSGFYRMVTSLFGAVHTNIQREKMVDELEMRFQTYHRGMAESVLGWRWTGTSLDSARADVMRAKRTEDRFSEIRKFNEHKRQRLIAERLGAAKKCRRCKRMRCVCKAPRY